MFLTDLYPGLVPSSSHSNFTSCHPSIFPWIQICRMRAAHSRSESLFLPLPFLELIYANKQFSSTFIKRIATEGGNVCIPFKSLKLYLKCLSTHLKCLAIFYRNSVYIHQVKRLKPVYVRLYWGRFCFTGGRSVPRSNLLSMHIHAGMCKYEPWRNFV